jgi:tetratricopeptide (TPR) repeat protein
LALGAGASEVFEKVKGAVVVVKAIDLDGQEVGQGSGVVLPSGQVATKNLVVPVEWLGELIAQSEKAEAPSEAKSPKATPKPTSPPVKPSQGSSTEWKDRATALEAAEDWAGLMEHSKRWTKAQPKEPMAWLFLGAAYFPLSRYQEAVNAYKEALRLKPDYANGWYNLGLAYLGLGNRSEALKAVQELRRYDPAEADKLFNIIMGR